MNTNELIELNEKLITKLQKSMMSTANKHLGQRYVYYDTYAEKHKKPPYRVRVTVNGEFVSNKSFKQEFQTRVLKTFAQPLFTVTKSSMNKLLDSNKKMLNSVLSLKKLNLPRKILVMFEQSKVLSNVCRLRT